MWFSFMNETCQLIYFILEWVGEESDILLSIPKCQNADDLFWVTTAAILVLSSHIITFTSMHLPKGGMFAI